MSCPELLFPLLLCKIHPSRASTQVPSPGLPLSQVLMLAQVLFCIPSLGPVPISDACPVPIQKQEGKPLLYPWQWDSQFIPELGPCILTHDWWRWPLLWSKDRGQVYWNYSNSGLAKWLQGTEAPIYVEDSQKWVCVDS